MLVGSRKGAQCVLTKGQVKQSREESEMEAKILQFFVAVTKKYEDGIPQKVLPSANHWKPDATAKRPGFGMRARPTMPPIRRPEHPM